MVRAPVLQLVTGNHDGLAEGLLIIFVVLGLAVLLGLGTLFLTVRAFQKRDAKGARRLAYVNAVFAVGSVAGFVAALPGPDAVKLLLPATAFGLASVLAFRFR